MISFEEALLRVLESAVPLGSERVSLDGALNRVLAQDMLCQEPMPPFDNSAMDGYAVATADFKGSGPWKLGVVGHSAAGGPLPGPLELNSACRIFTGAPLPARADSVLMQEEVSRDEDTITVQNIPFTGQNLRLRGADLGQGSVALACGVRLSPGKIALAAALDKPFVHVAQRPVVTVLCSGDELRSPGEARRPGCIVESNGFFVAHAARMAGATVRIAPFVRDTEEAAHEAIVSALRSSDVCVTIGGVSVGDHDVIRPALEKAGVVLDFLRVAIKPGKPLCMGRKGSSHVIGLPGNPASASLTFLLFGVPLLRALQGDAAPVPPRLLMPVRGAYHKKPGRAEFLRASIAIEAGREIAVLLPNQSSGAVTSFAAAEALVIVPADHAKVHDGDVLEAIRISDILN